MSGLAIPQSAVAQPKDDFFDDLVSTADYLPRFALFGSQSKACTYGLISVGRYGFQIGKAVTDCSDTVHAYALAVRYKAMDLTGDVPVALFDPSSSEFKAIQQQAAVKDSKCLVGVEFLLYLPEWKRFVQFYMASKTMKTAAPDVRGFLPTAENGYTANAFTLKSELIKKKQYAWHGPIVTRCSLTFDPPDAEKLNEELTKFLNPPAPNAVNASTTEQAAQQRDR